MTAQFVTGDDAEFVPKTRAYATGPRGPRTRKPEQLPWDDAFKAAMVGKGVLYAQVTPDEVDDARKHVAAAARLHERAATEGEPRPGKAKGTVLLAWKIRVPVARAKKSTASN